MGCVIQIFSIAIPVTHGDTDAGAENWWIASFNEPMKFARENTGIFFQVKIVTLMSWTELWRTVGVVGLFTHTQVSRVY